MISNNKLFSSLNAINGKTYPYGSKGVIRLYYYRSDPKLGPGIVEIIIIPWICHACTTILFLFWYSKIKESVNQPRYGRLYNCKYSQIIGYNNNCILMIFLVMEHMKKVTNTLIEIFFMVMWWKRLWSLCKRIVVLLMLMIINGIVNILSKYMHFYIPFNQTWVLMINLFLPVKWYVKEPIFFQSVSILIIIFTENKSNNTLVYLRTIINGNVNVICYDSKDIFPYFL